MSTPPNATKTPDPNNHRDHLGGDLVTSVKIAAIFFGIGLVCWIIRKAASRFHWTWHMPCATMCGVTIKGLWKLIHIFYNRKGLLLLYWTFYSILSSVIETSCTLQYPAVVVGPHEYRMRSWKRWWPPSQDYPNGYVSCAEGYCAENYTYEDFKIRVNETTSWWGSNEIVTDVPLIVKPGTIYNVMYEQCSERDDTLKLVVFESVGVVPIIAFVTCILMWFLHRCAHTGTFAQEVLLELELESSQFRLLMKFQALLALVASLLLYAVLQKGGDANGYGVYMTFAQNVGQFFLGFAVYLAYEGPLDHKMLMKYDRLHKTPVPNVVISPGYNILYTWSALFKTSDVFFTELICVLSLEPASFQNIRTRVRAAGAQPHVVVDSSDVEDKIQLVMKKFGQGHISHEWFTWYTDDDMAQMRNFMTLYEEQEEIAGMKVEVDDEEEEGKCCEPQEGRSRTLEAYAKRIRTGHRIKTTKTESGGSQLELSLVEKGA